MSEKSMSEKKDSATINRIVAQYNALTEKGITPTDILIGEHEAMQLYQDLVDKIEGESAQTLVRHGLSGLQKLRIFDCGITVMKNNSKTLIVYARL